MLDVCVVGLGAVGVIYAYILERSGKARVTAVCRSNYDIVQSHGIDIASAKFGRIVNFRPFRAVQHIEDAADRQYAFIVCTFKHYPDVSPTPTVIAPLLDTTGIFLLIQNGIGVHTDLGNAIGDNKTILSGCAWIDTTTVDGGRTVEHGIMEDLVIGIHLPPSAEQDRRERAQTALDLVVETLLAGGGGAIPTQNIDAQRWRKNLWNIGFSTLCTLTRLDVASVLTRRSLSFALPLVTAIMLESVSVARACGIGPDLLPDGAVGETIGLTLDIYGEGGTATASFKPSMLVDLEAGRPLEIEGILGSVMRLAMEKNVATPNIDMAYKTLKIIQNTLVARTES